MSRKTFPYQTVQEFIKKTGFGTYKLFTIPDNQLVAGSHLMADPEAEGKMSAENLLIDLESNIELCGNGLYRIVLKKSNKSQANTEVTYVFEVSDEGTAVTNGNASAMSGVSTLQPDKLEELITSRVNKIMELKEAEMKKQREVDELRRDLAELKKRKPVTRKKSDLQGLLNLALVGGSAFIVNQWPQTQPMVEKALGAIAASNGEEEEEEEEETNFTRPD